ncbi:hypothetical protein ACQEVG_24790 [Streptomyces sp. CA-135486]
MKLIGMYAVELKHAEGGRCGGSALPGVWVRRITGRSHPSVRAEWARA